MNIGLVEAYSKELAQNGRARHDLERVQRIIKAAGSNLERLWGAHLDTLPEWAVKLIEEAKRLAAIEDELSF